MDKQLHQKMLSDSELAEFCNQMGIVLHSGISPLEGLILLSEDALSNAEKTLLQTMIEEMENTGFFYQAVDSSGVFPSYALQMIKLGETTGCLDDIMTSLSEHYTRELHFAQMKKNALVYPCIMLGMMALIILILLTKVMPVFQQVFAQLGQEMTGFSAGLLAAGKALSRNSVIFAVLAVLAVLFFVFGKRRLPFQKKLQHTIASCRFCEGLAIALKSRITQEESLSLAADLIEHHEFRQKIAQCSVFLEEGSTLAESLQKSSILTGTYARIAALAEKTGSLDEALTQIAAEYEEKANHKMTGMIAMLEPTLVIILSIIVGIILFSVMLPLLGILSGL